MRVPCAVLLLLACTVWGDDRSRRVYDLTTRKDADDVDTPLLVELLRGGADPNGYRSLWGFSALMRAADNGRAGAVAALLEHGADVNARNAYGSTPLIKASRHGYTSIVRALLAKGAHVNARDWPLRKTALHKATSGGHHETMAELLRHSADSMTRDTLGLTAEGIAQGGLLGLGADAKSTRLLRGEL
eukprot:g2785.t1